MECCGHQTVNTGAVGVMSARQMATRQRGGRESGGRTTARSAIVSDREGWDGHWRGRGADRPGLRAAHGPPLGVAHVDCQTALRGRFAGPEPCSFSAIASQI